MSTSWAPVIARPIEKRASSSTFVSRIWTWFLRDSIRSSKLSLPISDFFFEIFFEFSSMTLYGYRKNGFLLKSQNQKWRFERKTVFRNVPKSRRELLNALNAASSFEYFWNNSFFIESFSDKGSTVHMYYNSIYVYIVVHMYMLNSTCILRSSRDDRIVIKDVEPVPDDDDRKSSAWLSISFRCLSFSIL